MDKMSSLVILSGTPVGIRIIPATKYENFIGIKDGVAVLVKKAMTAIFYVLRTGCQWKALPRSLGAPSTVHDRFQACNSPPHKTIR